MNSARHGMVLGKFYPPHCGHVYLCDFARRYVERLHIVVGTLQSESIDGGLRYRWMRQLFPDDNVLHLAEELPQEPAEHPDFWGIWERALKGILPGPIDYIFASEAYGQKLAEVLDSEYIPVDPTRAVFPVSGTAVRKAPYGHWDLIPDVVRRHYRKRVCVFGPESTGKSTLARYLASEFDGGCVPEFARGYIDEMGADIDEGDLRRFAFGQVASEEALACRMSDKLLVCDTDALLTSVWSHMLYGRCDPEIEELARSRSYDLYLLTDIDVPWVDDGQRYFPNERRRFMELCETTLRRLERPYVKVSGGWKNRKDTARRAVQRLFS